MDIELNDHLCRTSFREARGGSDCHSQAFIELHRLVTWSLNHRTTSHKPQATSYQPALPFPFPILKWCDTVTHDKGGEEGMVLDRAFFKQVKQGLHCELAKLDARLPHGCQRGCH